MAAGSTISRLFFVIIAALFLLLLFLIHHNVENIDAHGQSREMASRVKAVHDKLDEMDGVVRRLQDYDAARAHPVRRSVCV